jgi:hypothetical protein
VLQSRLDSYSGSAKPQQREEEKPRRYFKKDISKPQVISSLRLSCLRQLDRNFPGLKKNSH